MTVGRHRERPRIETIDHFQGRVSERDNCAPSGRVVSIEVDPFVEFHHRDPQINRGKANHRFAALHQLGDPAVTVAPENFGVDAFRVDEQDLLTLSISRYTGSLVRRSCLSVLGAKISTIRIGSLTNRWPLRYGLQVTAKSAT